MSLHNVGVMCSDAQKKIFMHECGFANIVQKVANVVRTHRKGLRVRFLSLGTRFIVVNNEKIL